MYKCQLCNKEFSEKRYLDQHNKKKKQCNIHTDYQCIKCNKYFRYKKNLKEHLNKICIDINNYDNEIIDNNENNIIKSIKSIIISSINDDMKIELINKYNIKLNNEQIKAILLSDMEINDKAISLNTFINKENEKIISNSTINNGTITTDTNSHNNTLNQNITINNFGKEDISYLDNDYFNNIMMNQHIEKGYIQLIKDIYLNKEHPENGTVKVENINNKYALVYNNGKWDTILKFDLKEQLHKKNYTILKMHYDKLKNKMSHPKKEETRVFLARDDTYDPHMMYVIDKIILLFYNDNDGNESSDKNKINNNI